MSEPISGWNAVVDELQKVRQILDAAQPVMATAPAEKRDPLRGGNNYEASMLRNLLARIHRDGGHYVEQHGLDKALDDAEAVIVKWLARDDQPAIKQWLIDFLKALEIEMPPPEGCHYALLRMEYGSDETGWSERLAVHMRIDVGIRNIFLDDADLTKEPAVLVAEIVEILAKASK